MQSQPSSQTQSQSQSLTQVEVELQIACAAESELPKHRDINFWVSTALQKIQRNGEMTVRIVDQPEMAELNQRYRGKTGPTNVLSFPFEASEVPSEAPLSILGDVVVCAPVVVAQAADYGTPLMAHWAHMVIHGTLHLCGFDHQEAAEAEQMESLEQCIMEKLGMLSY